MKIIFASGNQGKYTELKTLLQPLKIDLVLQKELNISEAKETGLTFIENAILKARHAAKHSGLPAIADDSGLEVFSLNGEPGIYSARYAGPDSNSSDNINKLLTNLSGNSQRDARFYCALVFLLDGKDPTPLVCTGEWRGTILEKPSGTKGFGYDPVFFDNNQNKSAAELEIQLKNSISHRGQALQNLLKQLPNKILEREYAGS